MEDTTDATVYANNASSTYGVHCATRIMVTLCVTALRALAVPNALRVTLTRLERRGADFFAACRSFSAAAAPLVTLGEATLLRRPAFALSRAATWLRYRSRCLRTSVSMTAATRLGNLAAAMAGMANRCHCHSDMCSSDSCAATKFAVRLTL